MEDKQDGGLCGRGFGKGGGGSRVSLGRTLENEKRGGTGGSASFWFSLTKPRLTNRFSTSVSWSITPSRPRSSVSCTYTPSRLAQTIKQPNKQTRRISGIFIFIFIFPVVQSSPPGSGGIITYAEDQIRSDRIRRRERMARSRWGACFSNPLTALHWTALHWTALHWTALHWTALHWTALHWWWGACYGGSVCLSRLRLASHHPEDLDYRLVWGIRSLARSAGGALFRLCNEGSESEILAEEPASQRSHGLSRYDGISQAEWLRRCVERWEFQRALFGAV